MRSRALTVMGLVVVSAIGCKSKPKEEAFVPTDPYTVAMVRDTLQKSDPSARVGDVVDVDPQSNLAAVADIPVGDFKEGDIVTFIDGSQKPLTTGRVVRIVPNSLHIKYDAPTASGRAPMVGDMAVRLGVK